ncbi:3-hydroxyacyl-[acyl-carrier-protein] dehydratase FabZ-like [Pyrus x bretschneideri]|uniref:3-hydroxyacyl-[acyl-carrier-protein] dehydratase FabZ-like n=1 Tax=Pyrus x bretschneideri TaxID=225117 RepID=UPI002030C020|nr:3-hydroxyacyl-[acyl-carrier-protein] dehydratase FabZ-like [Pyrus x bretschneideri]
MSAAISSSLFSLALAQSLTQPRNLRILHSPTSLSLPISPSLCLKSNRHPNFFACCSLNVQGSAAQVTPIEKQYPAFPTVMDINQIREILPHRVIEYNPGVSAVAIKNVTINYNFFPGHFPERPILPGVLMIEELIK